VRSAFVALAICLVGISAASAEPETECEESQIVALSLSAMSSQLDRLSVEWGAKRGDRSSQVALGMLLEEKGLPWLERAARHGSVVAAKKLHIHFAQKAWFANDSELRASSEKLAARWATEAAELGDMDMQRTLGQYLSDGRGVAKDESAAVRLWTKAAEQGSSIAQNYLSKALLEGRGTKPNYVESLKWGLLAAQKMSNPSFGRLQVLHIPALKAEMSDLEIARAEQSAQDWLAKYQQREAAKHDANERECGRREFNKGFVR
jgi:TPR repeat protein